MILKPWAMSLVALAAITIGTTIIGITTGSWINTYTCVPIATAASVLLWVADRWGTRIKSCARWILLLGAENE